MDELHSGMNQERPHSLSERMVALGAPARRYQLGAGEQVYTWARLQRVLAQIPACVTPSDAELRRLMASAWGRFGQDEIWSALPWSGVWRAAPLQAETGEALGWVLWAPSVRGVWPGLFPTAEAARTALLSGTSVAASEVDERVTTAGTLALNLGTHWQQRVPLLRWDGQQLRGPAFVHDGLTLLSALDDRWRRLPWGLVGLPQPPQVRTPPEAQAALADYQQAKRALLTQARQAWPRTATIAQHAAALAQGRWPDPDPWASDERPLPDVDLTSCSELQALPAAFVAACTPESVAFEIDFDGNEAQAARAVALRALEWAVLQDRRPLTENDDILGVVMLLERGIPLRLARRLLHPVRWDESPCPALAVVERTGPPVSLQPSPHPGWPLMVRSFQPVLTQVTQGLPKEG
ncbi:hypothetical protein [Deinococcus multiflagellatus]|uniref:Uncharacterized protein n=1 Tax=Deinococcus multiflagellatus TaxID=1656887 RepID=A0ABW1ZR82_9DEIO